MLYFTFEQTPLHPRTCPRQENARLRNTRVVCAEASPALTAQERAMEAPTPAARAHAVEEACPICSQLPASEVFAEASPALTVQERVGQAPTPAAGAHAVEDAFPIYSQLPARRGSLQHACAACSNIHTQSAAALAFAGLLERSYDNASRSASIQEVHQLWAL